MGKTELAEEPGLFHVEGVLLFAFSLQGMKLLHVLSEGAVDALFVKGDELKLLESFGGGSGVVRHGGEDAGFECAGVVETPAVFGNHVGELLLDGIFGFESFDELVTEDVVRMAVFRAHEDDLAGEIVADGVHAGAALAFK